MYKDKMYSQLKKFNTRLGTFEQKKIEVVIYNV